MSLVELGYSTGEVSIRDLFEGATPAAIDPGISVPGLIDCLVTGGWPALVGASPEEAQLWMQDYIKNLVEVDIQQLDGRRNPRNVRRLLTALGRAVGTDMTTQALAKDVGGAHGPADRDTVAAYLTALERLMVVENVEAWAPQMRSTTPLRKSEKRYMVDPSIGVGALGVGSARLLMDLNATGFHFEGMVVRDVRVYVQGIGGQLSHWRDNNGHEVDIIVSLSDGRWGAFEVKMNPNDVPAAADGLLRFAQKVNLDRVGDPSFMGVITTNSAAYRRNDGVLVIPLTVLGP
jgi:predicted AAA+ superfamily ATPase